MRSLFFPLAAIVFLASCQGGQQKATNAGLSDDTYNKLKTINEGLADNKEAIRVAFEGFHPESVTSAPSQKVLKMAELIHKGNCTRTVKEPAEAYDRSWTGAHEVSGAECPMNLKQNWSFDTRNRTWTIVADSFTAKSSEFQKESLIQSYTVSDGFLTVSSGPTSQKITGTINYFNFKVTGIGNVAANIRTEQNYTGSRGGGRLEFNIDSFKNFKVNVVITWSTGRTPIFRVNGKTVDQKDVEDLFSSFQLMELIDRSQKML